MAKKVLFIIGSLRKNSFNRQLSKEIAKLLDGRAELSYLDYADLPFMNQDAEFPTPQAVARVREAVQAADGIWICTPEYNATIPGVLKNLLDWLSRPLVANDFAGGTAIGGKKVTISGVGGKNATRGVRADLKKLLDFIRTDVAGGEGNGFALPAESFQTDTLVLAEEARAALKAQAEGFIASL